MSRRKGRQRRFVRHVARVEEERCLLADEVGQLAFEHDMVVRGAGDVAGAARARANVVERFLHGAMTMGCWAMAR